MKSDMLTIVANIHANPDQIDPVKAKLEKLIPITRAEEGCFRPVLRQRFRAIRLAPCRGARSTEVAGGRRYYREGILAGLMQ